MKIARRTYITRPSEDIWSRLKTLLKYWAQLPDNLYMDGLAGSG